MPSSKMYCTPIFPLESPLVESYFTSIIFRIKNHGQNMNPLLVVEEPFKPIKFLSLERMIDLGLRRFPV
ncbi:hypothetical protein J27TS7_54120 [Paenibacillus dendritiformis]|nr:hypothetical protein J27TS7_54120 [Paenibacillus dendritiformis]